MCDDVLAGKDELIRAYHQELKALDDAYVKSLKHNADDIGLHLGSFFIGDRCF